ncbi:sugar phosphate isomerase/epimerase [Paenibacillus sp. YYML68]|uniref:sugar phosphate isomerase/epimerase family protein n=1 Tax=Paenibacillus sp. YYML68 TaxID=2909250 RepID=UPI002492B6EB|nr:sugar phosphate isomerase/epimerase family protein [Paenibacillus sp. YYML68]
MKHSSRLQLALCTISFRHTLISFEELIQLARQAGFSGIELWGVHARQLKEERVRIGLPFPDLGGVQISMISDYLEVGSHVDFARTIDKCEQLLALCAWCGTERLRTFAGKQASKDTAKDERELIVKQLRILGDLCEQRGVELLLETHPGTLADQKDSALQLMQELEHGALKLNMDFLHLWEAGDDPMDSYEQLSEWVSYFHLKNIAARSDCTVFEPGQVYAPNGRRQGMVPLSQGAVSYRPLLERIADSGRFASLEWFGDNPASVLRADLRWINEVLDGWQRSRLVTAQRT